MGVFVKPQLSNMPLCTFTFLLFLSLGTLPSSHATVKEVPVNYAEGLLNQGETHVDACHRWTHDHRVHDLIAHAQAVSTPCPCCQTQAERDNFFIKHNNCYISMLPSNGTKQKCCYGETGSLLTGYPDGGFLILDHPDAPVEEAFSHCCQDPGSQQCRFFYQLNPSDTCSRYVTPLTAKAWGDPQIQTLSGHTYSFNGRGEYVYLKLATGSIEIQARTEYFQANNKEATIFTAFAVKIETDIVEFHLDRTTSTVAVYLNSKQQITFPQRTMQGLMIQKRSLKKYVVLFPKPLPGSSFAVSPEDGINAELQVQGSSLKNLRGLAEFPESGDLRMKNDSIVSLNDSESQLYDFGESWAVQNSDSLFNYSISGGNFTYYNTPKVRPKFLEDLVGNLTALFAGENATTIQRYNATCTGNTDCLLAIARTGSEAVGQHIIDDLKQKEFLRKLGANRPPVLSNTTTPTNVTATIGGKNVVIQFGDFVHDDFTTTDKLEFIVDESVHNFILENGVFNWTIGEEYRNSAVSLKITIKDEFNASEIFWPDVMYCGCRHQNQCNFAIPRDVPGKRFHRAACHCGEASTGTFCETDVLACSRIKCFKAVHCNNSKGFPNPCESCPTGYQGNGIECHDINECDKGVCNQGCNNTEGGFSCSCLEGYKLQTDNTTCADVDECALNKDNCSSLKGTHCVNIPGSFSCECSSESYLKGTECVHGGFSYVGQLTISAIFDRTDDLKDLDSVTNKNKIAKKLTEILNATEGFLYIEIISVTVVKGSRYRRENSGQLKVDYIVHWKNETTPNVLHDALGNAVRAAISSSGGSSDFGPFKASHIVTVVYKEDQRSLCDIGNRTDCDITTTNCVGGNGSFSCPCKEGYRPVAGSRRTCKDIDECGEGGGVHCMDSGTCQNKIGSWSCNCPGHTTLRRFNNTHIRCLGDFQYVGAVQLTWIHGGLDDNTTKRIVYDLLGDIFGNSSIEINGTGMQMSYLYIRAEVTNVTFEVGRRDLVHVHVQYVLHIGETVDTEELRKILNSTCGDGCVRTADGKQFHVNGFIVFKESSNTLCNIPDKNPCDPQSTRCKELQGEAVCECIPGFVASDKSAVFCNDIDECKDGSYVCSNHGTCVNTVGNWTCTCPAGYTSSIVDERNITCLDIDECNSTDYRCGGEGDCTNYQGSWNCTCRDGYSRTMFTENLYQCEDIDECAGDEGRQCSSSGGVCVNSPANWTCACKTGYEPNYNSNATCQDIDECNHGGYSCGGSCSNRNGGWDCLCPDGFKADNTFEKHITCEDIDECSFEEYQCEDGNCSNLNGSWSCTCLTGYSRTELRHNFYQCIDRDECKNDSYTCSNGGTCINTPGSWQCQCPAGFNATVNNEYNVTCIDIDECKVYNCTGGNCSNTHGSWTCDCSEGFHSKNVSESLKICEDIDECAGTEGDRCVDAGGHCSNNVSGGWACNCRAGFEPHYHSRQICQDVDECTASTAACVDAIGCENTIGNWTCLCREGLTLKQINATSKICSGDFKYAKKVKFHTSSPKTTAELKLFVQDLIEKLFRNVVPMFSFVEVISVTSMSQRSRRDTVADFEAVYVIHTLKPVVPEALDAAVNESLHASSQKSDFVINYESLNEPLDISLCDIPVKNHCDRTSTTCKFENGITSCPCNPGYTRIVGSEFSCQVAHTDKDDADEDDDATTLKSALIGVGAGAGGLVVLLLLTVFGVYRWRRRPSKDKDETLSMHEFGNGVVTRGSLHSHPQDLHDFGMNGYDYANTSLAETQSLNIPRPNVVPQRRSDPDALYAQVQKKRASPIQNGDPYNRPTDPSKRRSLPRIDMDAAETSRIPNGHQRYVDPADLPRRGSNGYMF